MGTYVSFRSARPVWHDKVLFHSGIWPIDCGYENGNALLLCHTGREQTKTKYFSIFQHAKNLWMRKCNAVVSEWLHPPSQSMSPIPPSRPFIGGVGHGAAVAPRTGEKSNLNATVYTYVHVYKKYIFLFIFLVLWQHSNGHWEAGLQLSAVEGEPDWHAVRGDRRGRTGPLEQLGHHGVSSQRRNGGRHHRRRGGRSWMWPGRCSPWSAATKKMVKFNGNPGGWNQAWRRLLERNAFSIQKTKTSNLRDFYTASVLVECLVLAKTRRKRLVQSSQILIHPRKGTFVYRHRKRVDREFWKDVFRILYQKR